MSLKFALVMKSILIIEDNAAVRENTAELLQLAGYDIATAVNGRHGFTVAKHNPPDAIICDIMMPETDGLMFFKLVKSDDILSHIPIIFFSAGSAPMPVKRKLEEGADVYLSKPFTEEELMNAVQYCLNKEQA
jgi:CheY-like chemotaxis protein